MIEHQSATALLDWPAGWKRTSAPRRSAFGSYQRPLTVYGAAQDVLAQLAKIRRTSLVVISSNMRVKPDGIPYSGQREPQDSGVAVYFHLRGEPRVLACDKWRTVAENLHAIALHLAAIRGQERWGVGTTEQAFRGFVGIPERAGRERTWREVFEIPDGVAVSREFVELQFKALARNRHPDHGGTDEAMAELSAARERARDEIGL